MQNAVVTSEPVSVATLPAPDKSSSLIGTSNSRSMTVQLIDGVTVHPIPTLDGFGLLIMSLLLGAAAFWIWRRQQ